MSRSFPPATSSAPTASHCPPAPANAAQTPLAYRSLPYRLLASCSAFSRFALTNHDSLIIADIQRRLLRAKMIRQIHIF
jgi:hypothetical protein